MATLLFNERGEDVENMLNLSDADPKLSQRLKIADM